MVTMPYVPYIVSGVWVHITLMPHGCMLSVYKALYPYVTREVLMNVIMNLPYVGRSHYRCEPWQVDSETILEGILHLFSLYIWLLLHCIFVT